MEVPSIPSIPWGHSRPQFSRMSSHLGLWGIGWGGLWMG